MSKAKQSVASVAVAMASGGLTYTQVTVSVLPKAIIVGVVAAAVFVIMSLLTRPRTTTNHPLQM